MNTVNENRISLAPDLVMEEVGHDLLVMIPSSRQAVTLTGSAAETVRTVASGGQPVADATVRELISLNILQGSSGMSRRALVKAGSIGALSTVAVLSMPTVAAANSSAVTVLTGYLSRGGENNSAYTDRLVVDIEFPADAQTVYDDWRPGEVSIPMTLNYKGTYAMEAWDIAGGTYATGVSARSAVLTEFPVFDGSPFTLTFSLKSVNYSAQGNAPQPT